MRTFLLLTVLGLIAQTSLAEPLGINLEGYQYPFAVKTFPLPNERETGLEMAYMDVAPQGTPEGRTVLLLHGKNFNGAYWESTARALSQAGFRVLIPDQIGFGKSSKPTDYSYTFDQLASNTRALLREAGVDRAVVVGHSMGGMLAVHWALLAPEDMERLILVNPIGLEDWTAKGVPYRGLAGWYNKELKATPQSIEAYQKSSYYDGKWTPEYARWANLLAAPLGSPDYPRLARVQALTSAMIMSQPVASRFAELRVPTTLILGQRDRTAVDKDLARPDLARTLGRYDLLGPEVAARIPDARLIPLEGLGHLPHIEDFSRFWPALMEALR